MATNTMTAKPEDRSYLAEVGDFLFATDTIAKIARGEGTWSDAALVGVTAASFFIPPAKLAMLSSKALGAVIKASGKVATSETASVAAKRAAAKTLDDALTMKRQGYIPTGKEPVERVGRAGLGEPTPAYQVGQSILKRGPKESDAAYAKRVKDYEEGVPTPAALAERGKVVKKYTRTPDEEYDVFKRDLTPEQEAEDIIASSRTAYRERGTGKYVSNPKKTFEQKSRADLEEAAKSEKYDKVKFTQDEIDDRIAGLSKKELNSPGLKRQEGESLAAHRQRLEEYVRGGDIEDLTPVPFASTTAIRKTGEYTQDEIDRAVETFRRYVREPAIERDIKEVTSLYAAARRMVKTVKVNSQRVPEDRRISRQDLKVIKESFIKLKKEFKEKVLETEDGKALLREIEKETPLNPKSRDVLLRFEENIADNAKPGELKAIISEAIDDTPITPTIKGTTRTGKAPVRIKETVPDDLKAGISSDVERAASLLAEKEKLTTFNKANTNKLKTANPQEVSKIKQSSARNNKIIQRINDELREIRSNISSEDKMKAQEIADEITKRNLAKRSEKYGPFEGPINPPRPVGKGGETAKLTKRGRIEKAKAEVERLREEWRNTPASDTEARSRLAREAKKFADYIKKLEGN